MDIELISIGDEVLRGYTLNTNVTFLAQKLTQAGHLIRHQEVIPDESKAIVSAIEQGFQRGNVVITTGGLGPTLDDITRKSVVAFFGGGFRYDETVAADLKHRFGEHLATLEDQATVPAAAVAWLNTIGTAPGLLFASDRGTLIMLPGVPDEMQAFCEREVIPYLEKERAKKPGNRVFNRILHLIQLKESDVDPLLRELADRFPTIAFGIYPAIGAVSVRLSVFADDAGKAAEEMEGAIASIRERFSSRLLDAVDGCVEEAIQRRFIEKGLKLGVAESCTGGYLSSRLTAISGASHYFQGSVVSYANAIKSSILGVDPEVIQSVGAVSEEVVKAMAAGALDRLGCDVAIAVTGIAGPEGGTAQKPVGTVWCGLAWKGESPKAWLIRVRGNRERIVRMSAAYLLNTLYLELLSH